MRAQEIIRLKRDGGTLAAGDIRDFISGVSGGEWSRGQMGAMLMACFLQGLNSEETSVLLNEMLHSGEVLDFSYLGKPVVDKHSTGGVGDKVSIVLAPLAAACGLAVPMLSGRGLGHTGGTLDKLESIPGFNVFLEPDAFREQVERLGVAMGGQTAGLAPADRILYAMRDETSTVEHSSLIAASILSKKLAEGLDGLLLDVKVGKGAFFADQGKARELAELMVDLGKRSGCRVSAWLTSMDAPLGRAVGNAVEIAECIELLKGEGPDALRELICEEVAGMLVLGELAESHSAALKRVIARLKDGSALERFRELILAQDGDPQVIEHPEKLPQARVVEEILHEEPETLWVAGVDARKIAELVLAMGAGRRDADDTIDPSVGLSGLVCEGESVEPGSVLGRLHYADPAQGEEWRTRLFDALQFSREAVAPKPLILERLETVL
jgi:pyrimidine-nucleoside phosphorylase